VPLLVLPAPEAQLVAAVGQLDLDPLQLRTLQLDALSEIEQLGLFFVYHD
jgi:hypothetical protein